MKNIEELTAKIEEVVTANDAMGLQIGALGGSFTDMRTEVDSAFNRLEEQIAANNPNVEEQVNQLEGLRESLSSAATQVGEVKTTIDAVTEDARKRGLV